MYAANHCIVADDNENIRIVIARVLDRMYPNIRITSTGNGLEALRSYGQYGADLAVVDYKVPFLSGADLTRSLRARQALLPIIVISGDPAFEARALAAGANHFMVKPFELSQFIDLLARLMPFQSLNILNTRSR